MKRLYTFTLLFSFLFISNKSFSQEIIQEDYYTFKRGDYNGIGKWYMGREIAYVMGFQGIGWLERSTREKEENVTNLINNMKIKPNDTIADIGAGSGYHTFRMAPLAAKGMIYAIDIQPEMLMSIENTKASGNFKNVKAILGTETRINLPRNSVNKILMVDVYHEFNYPYEMIKSIKDALKPKGQLFLIEYRGEDPKVPIKRIHKMTEKQAVKEMNAAGFKLKKNLKNLPWQHCMIFELSN